MTTQLKPGDKVEINQIWAGGRDPLRAWFKGYEFVSSNGKTVVVKATTGLYEGRSMNFDALTVRKAV